MASATMKASKSLSTIFLLILLLSFQVIKAQQVGQDGSTVDGSSVDGSSELPDIKSKSNVTAKIWSLFILLVISLFVGVLPYFFRSCDSFLLLGTQFSGGVLLGTSLMHYLADSTNTFPLLTTKVYPFSFMLASSGYLIAMLIYCIVIEVIQLLKKEKRVEVEEGKKVEGPKENAPDLAASFARWTGFLDVLLLLFSLSVHSIFEGIDIGTSAIKGDVWSKVWRTILHRVFAALAMAIALLKTQPKSPFTLTVVCSLAFSVTNSIGLGVGISLNQSDGNTVYWIYAISMGIVCGFIIYVASNRLIANGFKPNEPCCLDTPFYKFLAAVAGVAVIAVAMIWVS